MRCNHCGAEVEDGAKFCRYCGKELSAPAAPKNKKILIASAVAVAAAAVVGGVFCFLNLSKDDSAQDDMVAVTEQTEATEPTEVTEQTEATEPTEVTEQTAATEQTEPTEQPDEEYLRRSDELLAAGDCLGALEAVQQGVAATGLDSLKEREEYLRAHIKAFPKTVKYPCWIDSSMTSIADITSDFYCAEYEYEFSEEGLPVSSTCYYYYSDDPNKVISEQLEYNDHGDITTEEYYSYQGDDGRGGAVYQDSLSLSGGYYYSYEYDENGNKIKKDYVSDNGYASTTTFSYDENNRISGSEETWEDGSCETSYFYDEYGHLCAEQVIFYHDGSCSSSAKHSYRYDSQYDTEVEISRSIYDPETDTWRDDEYGAGTQYLTYDEYGNVIEKRGVTAETDTYMYSFMYRYDSLGNTVCNGEEVADAYCNSVTEYMYIFYPDQSQTASDAADGTANAVQDTAAIDVEAEVTHIRELYYGMQEYMNECRTISQNGMDIYYDAEILVRVQITGDDTSYSRDYYYDENVALSFAFLFQGTEEHRFYFKDDTLIRYIAPDGTVYDYGDSALDDYTSWGATILNEAYVCRDVADELDQYAQ